MSSKLKILCKKFKILHISHFFFFWKTVKYGLHVSVSFRNLTLIPKMASDFMWERLTWIYCVPTLRAYIARLLLWTKHGLNTTIQKLTVIHISNFTVQQKNINWESQYVWRWMIPNSGLKNDLTLSFRGIRGFPANSAVFRFLAFLFIFLEASCSLIGT